MGWTKKQQQPNLRPRVIDTAWWGDNNLDTDQSDLNEWCRTADLEHLVALPGEELHLVKYRGLTPTEQAQIPNAMEHDSGLFLAQAYQATRYGLISIAGMPPLNRARSRGIRGLTTQQLDELAAEAMMEEIPIALAIREMYGLEDDDAPITNSETSFAVWLGVHILGETFRSRGGNS